MTDKSKAPRPGIVFTGDVVRVIDGDTLVVRPIIEYTVRLRDCWAPELSSSGGSEAKRQLERLVNSDTRVTVSLPWVDGRHSLGDVLSFGRLVGDVYVGDQRLSDRMVQSGHATKTKS